MKEVFIRLILIIIGITGIVTGLILFESFIKINTAIGYVYPKLAFYGALFFIGFGGYMISLGTLGWHGFKNSKFANNLNKLFGSGDTIPKP